MSKILFALTLPLATMAAHADHLTPRQPDRSWSSCSLSYHHPRQRQCRLQYERERLQELRLRRIQKERALEIEKLERLYGVDTDR